jgi:hypothetical protein
VALVGAPVNNFEREIHVCHKPLSAHYSEQRFLMGKSNNFEATIGNNSVFSIISKKTI